MTGAGSGNRQPAGGRWTALGAAGMILGPAVIAGFVVFLLLFPFSGDDSDPPTCYSVFDYVVPCGSGLAVAAGLATGVVVAVGLLAVRHWRR
jgi:hypothetical protein